MAQWCLVRTLDAARHPAGDPEQITQDLGAQFLNTFGREAAGTWFAPGRANLNGEHIDFHGGRCLPMALPHGTYVAAAPRTDGILQMRTLDPELDSGVIASGPDAPSWTHYVSGVLWALQGLGTGAVDITDDADPALVTDLTPEDGFGADLLILSTVPVGGGLSSSAALECACALAFVGLGTPLGHEHPEDELTSALSDDHRALLAQACIRAEVEFVGAGTGGLDQTVSLRGAENRILSLDCRDFTVSQLNAACLLRGYRFLAVDTRQAHWLGDGQFAARRAEAEAAGALLGFSAAEGHQLREALPERKPKKLHVSERLAEFDEKTADRARITGPDGQDYDPASCRRRLKHALMEMLRSEKLHTLLAEEAFGLDHMAAEIGEIMTAGHVSMRDEAEVSFPAADRIVDAALGAGAAGARLIGGGFGGSVLVLVHEDRIADVAAAALKVDSGLRFLDVEPSAAARRV